MRESDYDEFAQLLDAAFDLIGKTPAAKIISSTSKALFFQALADYPMPAVRAAIGEHIKRGEFTPTPAAIIKILDAGATHDTRPGPEEAWSIALASQDEHETVVWTAEIAEAMQIARPVLDSSGPITGRKTFLEAYARLVAAARQANQPEQWTAHMGWDKERQAVALHRAVQRGLLPPPRGEMAKLLEHAADMGLLPRTGDYSAVPLLAAPERTTEAEPDGRPAGLKRLKEVMATLENPWEKAQRMRDERVKAEFERDQQRAAEIAQQVQQYQASHAK